MIQPKVVLLIFVSGKIVLTGAKVRSEIYEAFNKIYNVLAGELLLEGYVSRCASDIQIRRRISKSLEYEAAFDPQTSAIFASSGHDPMSPGYQHNQSHQHSGSQREHGTHRISSIIIDVPPKWPNIQQL